MTGKASIGLRNSASLIFTARQAIEHRKPLRVQSLTVSVLLERREVAIDVRHGRLSGHHARGQICIESRVAAVVRLNLRLHVHADSISLHAASMHRTHGHLVAYSGRLRTVRQLLERRRHISEVVVLHALLRRQPLVTRVLEHLQHEVDGIVGQITPIIELLSEMVGAGRHNLRELYAFLLRQLMALWPVGRLRRAKHSDDAR